MGRNNEKADKSYITRSFIISILNLIILGYVIMEYSMGRTTRNLLHGGN
jgi:hypothetical protein